MLNVYAFDVDETLEISNGPVTLAMMEEVRAQGHIVGICGNWGLFCHAVQNWHSKVSFLSVGIPKAEWLAHFARYVRADEYVLVGNVKGTLNSLGVVCNSEDSIAAAQANWRFIKEDDFARGVR